MKIDNSLSTLGGITTEGASTRNGKADAPKSEPGVNVALSGLASELRAPDAQASGGEVVDVARVAEIKQAISEGRFKINPDVVADRLLQTVKELIGPYRQ